ncbi:MAG: 2-isopropylmalate synthase [Nitrososphaerota archaeon]
MSALSLRNTNFPSKIFFLDTTLRDGEQTPGVSLTPENKLKIASKLEEIGIDFIEAGFAAASRGEFKALKLISEQGFKAEIYSFSRCVKSDIDSAADSSVDGITLTMPTSDLHLNYKLNKNRHFVIENIENCIDYAKGRGLIIEFLAEDGSRSDLNFLEIVFMKAAECKADRVCLCDTVGILTPEKTIEIIERLTKSLRVPLAIHCHNDFGMAVANSIIALKHGAQEVHVTINGLGERAGNAALEEIVANLEILYGYKTNIKTNLIYETSKLVSQLTGIYVQPNKAIVGENAFAHESGIHTHGVIKNPLTYEPIPPEFVGASRRIIVGKHAGSHGLKESLKNIGFDVSDEQLSEILKRVKDLGDKGKKVTDADLQVITETVLGMPKIRPIKLKEVIVVTGNNITSTAFVKLKFYGKTISGAATGVGPVDAAINAIKKLILDAELIKLEEYHVSSITGGTDAIVEVIVKLRRNGKVVTSRGARENIVIASVEAILSGMNLLLANYKNLRGYEN